MCLWGQVRKVSRYIETRNKINPNKIKAGLKMDTPKNVKKVQNLNGRLTALGRFILKLGDNDA